MQGLPLRIVLKIKLPKCVSVICVAIILQVVVFLQSLCIQI